MKMGKTQELTVKRITSVGAFLNEEGAPQGSGDVLLPKKYVPEGTAPGAKLRVFVMRDSEDRPLATTRIPKAEVGDFAVLPVAQVTNIGAFLDWGLEKDLFLPFEEQLHHVKATEKVLVYVYIDKSGRIASTMKVKPHFTAPKKLKENDWVDGVVYSTNPEIGAFVLVEEKYNALIPKSEMQGALKIGESIRARVQNVKPDGKIDLSLRSRTYESLDSDAMKVRRMLEQNNGFLRVNDKSRPEDIQMLFGMSKAQFKRAVGRLLKQRAIRFEDGGIRRVEKERRK